MGTFFYSQQSIAKHELLTRRSRIKRKICQKDIVTISYFTYDDDELELNTCIKQIHQKFRHPVRKVNKQ